MSDQATAVDPEAALFDALNNSPEEEEQETTENPDEGQTETEEVETEGEVETETPPELFKITVKGEDGKDEEKEVSLEDLAAGYMLQADYTRKTTAVAEEKRQLAQKFSEDLTKHQQSTLDRLGQLRELVLRQAAPELASVDWDALSTNDPAEFVRLQAKQQKLQRAVAEIDHAGQQQARERDQHLNQQVDQALKQSDEILTKAIDGFNAEKAAKLLENVEKAVGWKPSDIRLAAAAMAQAGMRPETIGHVLLLAHKAIQFDELTAKKATVLKKVAAAPKVIRPSAPQPKKPNQAALDRLKKTGRGEDFMKFL